MSLSRRDALKVGVGAGAVALLGRNALQASSAAAETATVAGPIAATAPQQAAQLLRTIPSTGERIPAVGLGTANTFMQAARTPSEQAAIREVVKRFTEHGGKFIDTCPCYGTSETVLGELARDVGNVGQVQWATKISGARGKDAGMAQHGTSEQRLQPGKIFLNQVHNLGDWQVQLALLRELKQAGRIKYVGVTTTSENQYAEVERILRTEQLDFVMVDYAADNREVEQTIFPIAKDRGIATIAALPFGRARLFARTTGRPVPEMAAEIDAKTWAQFFLKYLLGHPDMTVVIPGTSNPDNLVDNMGAGLGRLPDEPMRRRMAAIIDALPPAP